MPKQIRNMKWILSGSAKYSIPVVLVVIFCSCNMWAYRGHPDEFDSDVYQHTYFDLDSNAVYFPTDISKYYYGYFKCNDDLTGLKDFRFKYCYKFPSGIFDSCKSNEVRIVFIYKKNTKVKFEFTIPPSFWLGESGKRKPGQIYAPAGSIRLPKDYPY